MPIGSLSHRPILITASIVFCRIWNLFHEKNAAPWAGHEPKTSVTLVSAHRPTILRYGEKLAGLYWNANELLSLCYCLCWFWLVGLSPSDISWRPLLVVIYAIMWWPFNLTTVQFWLFVLGQLPTTNNTQTKHMQPAERLWIRVQVQPFFYLNV